MSNEQPAPKKRGRQSTYTEEKAERIIAQLSDGIPLREICRQEGMPHWNTVYDWMNEREDFAGRIARAREIGEDAIAQECLRIADTPLEGIEVEESESGTKTKRSDMLGHRKLQIETRLKLLAKWNPKKWGDRQALEHSGPDGQPLTVEIVRFGQDPASK